MQLKSSRTSAPLWRKLFVALMTVALAVPFLAMPASAAQADRLTVMFTAPKAGDKVSGFVNTAFVVNPRGMLGVPARREENIYRAYSLSYAQGADVRDDGSFSVWRIDGGTISRAAGAAAGARDLRNAYVQPGVGSIRPPRAGGHAWDSTLVPDGPATLRLRGFAYDGSFKDAYVTFTVENKGVSPEYVEVIAPKSGDTVKGWVPVTLTAMPQWAGINTGRRGTRYTNYLPSSLDVDLNFVKVEYATGANPSDTEFITWWFNSTANATKIREQIAAGVDGALRPSPFAALGPAGSDHVYINRGGTNWDSTLVPDGPATIRVTVVFNDGSYRTFDRVVNVDNKGQGNIYFGIDKAAITGPISGEGWGVPGYAGVPRSSIPRWTFELPIAYYACDIAAGDVTGNAEGASWTMFWVNDNTTWNEVRDAQGWTIGGDTRLPDWSHPGYGRSGGLCRLDTTTVPNGVYTIQLRLHQAQGGPVLRDWVVVTVRNS